MRRLVMRNGEKWIEIVRDEDKFRLYTSFGKMEKGKPEYFEMDYKELLEFKSKLNIALRQYK